MDTAKPAARAGNLTAALVVVAGLELVLNRLGGRLFFPRATLSLGGGSRTSSLVAAAGPFLFQLTAVLSLGVLVAALVGVLRRGEIYPRAMRFSVAFIGLVFVIFDAQGLLRGQLPPRLFVYLETSYGFLALLTAVAVASARAPARVKLGISLFALPGALHAAAILSAGLGHGDGTASALAAAGEAALIAAAVGAPLLLPLPGWRDRHWRLPVAVAGALTVLFVLVLFLRFDLMQASALYALRMELPPPRSVAGFAYVVGFFAWTLALLQLFGEPGGMRLAAYGLGLLALGGYDAGSPVELSLSLLGLLALTVGEVRAARAGDPGRPRIAAGDWRAFVGRLATAAGDGTQPDESRPQAVIAEEGELEVSRIQTYRRGYPVTLKLMRRRGAVVELDATVGAIGRELPDASVERHRRWLERNPENRLNLPRLKTGDASFDQKFSVHGPAPIGDPELRHRLARQQGDGVLTIWNGRAARYVLANPAALDEAPALFAGQLEGDPPVTTAVALLDTLADLVEASTPADSDAES
ncbi:MAG TPA: hypothetical protein VHM31_12475 [Polyangia bacterium]|nr:hypothetical protein [Polyangia bacterium]